MRVRCFSLKENQITSGILGTLSGQADWFRIFGADLWPVVEGRLRRKTTCRDAREQGNIPPHLDEETSARQKHPKELSISWNCWYPDSPTNFNYLDCVGNVFQGLLEFGHLWGQREESLLLRSAKKEGNIRKKSNRVTLVWNVPKNLTWRQILSKTKTSSAIQIKCYYI